MKAAALTALLLLASCAACSSTGSTTRARAETALLKVTCPVADAMVWIDERVAGRVDEVRGGIRLRPGAHRIEVRHDRYHTRYVEVELARGETKDLPITLSEVLD